ncbi:MAG: cryptochrome/photolyase family protein [Pyrinomonadaceae bacterium]|nr:cryptochrome/photolyase family protein [Pyrinomonadaceae bacterium]
MKIASLIFPNQLFENNPAVSPDCEVFLVEEYLYFKQFNFHKQKLCYHRATMKFYEDYLTEKGVKVNYISSNEPLSDVRKLVSHIIENKFTDIHFCDVSDNYLERRIKSFGESVKLTEFATPMFLNSKQEVDDYFKGKKNYLQASFYTEQRKKRKILVDDQLKPIGGKWSFDEENRLKYPKNKVPPLIEFPAINDLRREATDYVKTNFGNNYGELSSDFSYPVTHEESRAWLQQFLEKRFREFGHYEDAIVTDEHILNHGLLTPMLNVGLLTPQETVDTVLEFAEKNDVPLNSTEGFIRQIIGWREFIRGVYETSGTVERKGNFFKFKRKIPESFWTGTTGIEPLDAVIKKVLKTGYCHHIERLMVVGNFMILCEFDPDDVHRWFMELFIDSYDWVMVPNVYGMSQFADGGLISTKPYISGSNYLMKMSDFEKGDWQNIWDGLFWSFMDKQRDFFLQNPRLGMLVRTFDKMNADKRVKHLETAGKFLDGLDA